MATTHQDVIEAARRIVRCAERLQQAAEAGLPTPIIADRVDILESAAHSFNSRLHRWRTGQ